MKKIIYSVLIIAVLLVSLPFAASAQPEDWRVILRNLDDTEDITIGAPTRATSSFAVFGGRKDDSAPSWYYFGPEFSVNPAPSGFGASNYKITLDVGAISDVMVLYTMYDELYASKVSTTTLASTIAGLSSGTQIQTDWSQASTTLKDYIKNKPSLFSGTYADLTGKPTLFSGAYSDLTGKPSFATVATSGAYADLSGKPSLATVATSGVYADLSGKPSIGLAYEGTTQRTGVFPVFKSSSVSGTTVVFHLTADGTSGGTALCPNGVIADSIQLRAEEGTTPHAFSAVTMSNSNKTATITVSKLATVLGILTLNQSATGSVIKMTAWCY